MGYQKLENEVRKKLEKKSHIVDDYMIEKLNLNPQTQDVYSEFVTLNVLEKSQELPKNNSPFWTTEQLKSLTLVNNDNSQDSTFSYNIITNVPNTKPNEEVNNNINEKYLSDNYYNENTPKETKKENNITSIQAHINKTYVETLLKHKKNMINMRNLNLLSK